MTGVGREKSYTIVAFSAGRRASVALRPGLIALYSPETVQRRQWAILRHVSVHMSMDAGFLPACFAAISRWSRRNHTFPRHGAISLRVLSGDMKKRTEREYKLGAHGWRTRYHLQTPGRSHSIWMQTHVVETESSDLAEYDALTADGSSDARRARRDARWLSNHKCPAFCEGSSPIIQPSFWIVNGFALATTG